MKLLLYILKKVSPLLLKFLLKSRSFLLKLLLKSCSSLLKFSFALIALVYPFSVRKMFDLTIYIGVLTFCILCTMQSPLLAESYLSSELFLKQLTSIVGVVLLIVILIRAAIYQKAEYLDIEPVALSLETTTQVEEKPEPAMIAA